jgi:hypothetical protein
MATAENPVVSLERVASRAATVPWYIWTGAAAVTSSTIGGVWDVSWHRSIGRDSFWTPAHMMIYLCGVLAGIVGLYLVIQSTRGHDPELRAASVSVFGLRAPFGVFLAGWGGLAMLTSAPFDNWWHNAYGLDVQIVSPPHTVLILGVRAVAVGMIFLILAAMNRTAAAAGITPFHLSSHSAPTVLSSRSVAERSAFPSQPATGNLQPPTSTTFRTLQLLFLYLGGLSVAGQMFFLQEFTWDVLLHRAAAYIAMGIGLPFLFAAFWESSRFRWACTATAAIYTLLLIAEILILPLFPAQPRLGPVFFPVTHMVPAKFPILILLPALALDLLWQRTRTRRPWQIALTSGVLFIAVLVAVEWPFAHFLMSHASQNRFFGTGYYQFDSRATGPDRMRIFLRPDHGAPLCFGLLRASLYAAISTWFGLISGRWMRGVQR